MMKSIYKYPDIVIHTMDGVHAEDDGRWSYHKPKDVMPQKKAFMLKARTLDGLYKKMVDRGVSIDPDCSVSKFVNKTPSKLIISPVSIKVRVNIVDEAGVFTTPQLLFSFDKESIVSFTKAMTNAQKVLELEAVNRRLANSLKKPK